MRVCNLPLLLSTIGLICLLGTTVNGQSADDNVSSGELDGFQLLYALNDVPSALNVQNGVPWDVNNSDTPLSDAVAEIGVYYELDGEWVWAAVPAYTQDLTQMGIPEFNTNPFVFQQTLSGLTVETNSDFVTPGTFDQANVEIWSTNYAAANGADVPDADASTFDFGDVVDSSGNYGSFQFHNTEELETIFAINRFNAGDAYDTTIGNSDDDNPDGTFGGASANFDERILQIWVKPFEDIAGDFNADGAVDNADFLVFSANFNETGTTRDTGDLNGDFATDLRDFIIFRESFNAQAGAAVAASVPEPATFSLACLAALMGVLSTRRRQSR